MTQGSILQHLLNFAVPLAIGLLFQQLYNTVDTLVVGRFVGKEAQAAVGSTGSIINTVVGFCSGLSTGSSVIVSQRYGAHDDRGLSRAMHAAIVLTFLLSIFATALGIITINPMLRFMQTPEDVMEDARRYLTIYFAGVSDVLFYNMGSSILRAVGDSRHPLIFLIISALLNTGLDLLFVLGFGMKVDGVAYATVAAQVLSSLLILFTLSRTHTAYGLRWQELRLDRASLRGILKIGLPSAVQSAITAFSNVFVQSYKTCVRYGVKFTFGQTGDIFIQDGIERKIHNRTDQAAEALRTGFTYPAVDIEAEVQKLYDEKAAKKAAFEAKRK